VDFLPDETPTAPTVSGGFENVNCVHHLDSYGSQSCCLPQTDRVVGKCSVMFATSSDRDQDHLGWSHRVVSNRYERHVYRISASQHDSPVPRIVRRQNIFVQSIDLDVQVPCLRVGRSSLGVERCRGDTKVPQASYLFSYQGFQILCTELATVGDRV
jgi:hypothetical protein